MAFAPARQGSSGFTITKFGPWQKSALALRTLAPELRSAAMWGQRKVAEKYVKIVKGHIDNQDLGWIPLADSTNTGDTRILVDTEAYRNAIKAWREGFRYNAGVPKRATNYRGISIVDYATLHEYGWGNMPMRPLWAPSFVEMGGKVGIKAVMVAAIYSKLARLKAAGFTVVT